MIDGFEGICPFIDKSKTCRLQKKTVKEIPDFCQAGGYRCAAYSKYLYEENERLTGLCNALQERIVDLYHFVEDD